MYTEVYMYTESSYFVSYIIYVIVLINVSEDTNETMFTSTEKNNSKDVFGQSKR